MPKFTCSCGHVINLSGDTSAAELNLVPETNILEISELLAEGSKLSDEQFFNLIDKSKKIVYECPVCMRLHIKSGTNRFDTYVLESAKNE